MTGRPTLDVRLDDGSGTFPYVITPYVSLRAGISLSRGRGDEFDDVDAATFNLTLKNNDGRFSLGSAAYGCRADQQIRMVVSKGGGGYVLTGFVQEWPTSWDGPLGNKAWAKVTVIDVQARLARHALGSMVTEEGRVNGVLGYWPMTEEAGTVSAGSRMGNVPALSAAGAGVAPAFAAVEGPVWVDGSVPLFTANGQYLRSAISLGVRNSWVLSAFVSTSTPSTSNMYFAWLGERPSVTFPLRRSALLGIDSAGKAMVRINEEPGTFAAVSSTTSIDDGKVHHVAGQFFVAGPNTVARVWVDGVLEGFATFPWPGLAYLEGRYVGVGSTSGIDVAVSNLLVGPGTVDPADINGAAASGFAGETAAARLARIGAYLGVATSSSATTILAGQQLQGVKAWEAMKAVAASEGGRLYVDGWGVVRLDSRQESWSQATSTPELVTSVGNLDHDDLVIQGDKQYLKNRVSGTREGGAQQTVDSQLSIDKYDVYEDDLGTLLVLTDEDVYSRCAWFSQMYDEPEARLSSVTINLLTAPTDVVESVLPLEIGSRIQITGLPSQSPIATADLLVEGWSEQITHDSWSRTFNTSPATLQQPWILGDSTFGVLGETTRPAY